LVSHTPPKPQSVLQVWLTWALPILAVLIAYRESPWFAFISDDVFLIPANPFLRGPGALWQNLTHDYFWSASGNSIPYWRPVTKGSWVLELALWNGWSGGFHMDQVAIHLMGVLGVVYFVRRLGGGHVGACVAGLVYGLSPNLIEPTCSVMARSDVAVTAASIWSVVTWLRWIQTRRIAWAVVHGLCLMLALGSKETAVVLPAVLALWAVLGVETENLGPAQEPSFTATTAARLRMLANRLRYLVPAVLITVAYLVARRFVLGAHHGVPLVFDAARIALVDGQAFFSVLPFHLDATANSVLKAPWLTLTSLASVIVGWSAFVAALAVAVYRRRPRFVVLLAWALASLAPIVLVAELNVPVAPNLFPLAGRWVASAAAVAAILTGLFHGWLPRPWMRTAFVVLTAFWSLVELATSGSSHAAFRDTESMVQRQDAGFWAKPESQRTLMDKCDFAERQILRAINEGHPQKAIEQLAALNKDCLIGGGRFRLLQLRALVDLSRFDEAFAVAESLFREDVMESRYHAEAYYLAGVAASSTRQWKAAEAWLRAASSMGYPSCNLGVTMGLVLAQTGRLAEAAGAYEGAGRCSSSDARPWLAAAMLWVKAQQPGHAAVDLVRARQCQLDSEQRQLADHLAASLK
jgi:hypothetical protein